VLAVMNETHFRSGYFQARWSAVLRNRVRRGCGKSCAEISKLSEAALAGNNRASGGGDATFAALEEDGCGL